MYSQVDVKQIRVVAIKQYKKGRLKVEIKAGKILG